LVLLIILNGTSTADIPHGSSPTDENFKNLHIGLSHPGEIPDFTDFNADTIDPGNPATLSFIIQNRYTFNEDNNMYNVSLIVNIYLYISNEESGQDVSKLKNKPKITGGNDALSEIPDGLTAKYQWSLIRPNETVPVKLAIETNENMKEGTYFIRMHLNFTFNNTFFDMKSRGYFTNDQWERAQPNATDIDGLYGNKFIIGRLDLNVLDVDGLIPETSIHLRKPIPRWPVYLGIGGIVFFALLALIFYLMDEKGKFPKAKKKLDDFSTKVNNFRYRR
jgi:hypothetical protein